ncbi:MAG: hypothetical protein N2654_02655 [Deltaproteobacteria bacterium]|nr:hypothetical protein [Deltaproteobacteria bacterium]
MNFFLFLLITLFCRINQAEERATPLTPKIEVINFNGSKQVLFQKDFVDEGEVWNSEKVLFTENQKSKIIISFREPKKIGFIAIQADANDSYLVECLDVNKKSLLWIVPHETGKDGLWIRSFTLKKPQECLTVHLRPGVGDGKYSIGKVLLEEKEPMNWQEYKNQLPKKISYVGNSAISVERMNAIRLGVIFFTILVLFINHERIKRFGLLFCLFLGLWCWYNCGRFHLTRYFHAHDVFHYYVGSKYSPELGYRLIYRCVLLATQELGLPVPKLARNLETNLVVTSEKELEKSATCKIRFSEDRWKSFVSDIRYFTKYHGNFSSIVLDHGYNASPFWNIIGYFISNIFQATDVNLTIISFLDSILISIGLLLSLLAFGLKPVSILVVFWGTAQHADYGWTGNSFLRLDWFSFILIGTSLLKLQWSFPAYIAFTIAAGLRIFPGLCILGLLLARVFNSGINTIRLTQAVGLICVAFVFFELALFGNFNHIKEFKENLKKHAETFSTNVVGIRIIVSYSEQSRAITAKDLTQDDEFGLWKQQRLKKLEERKFILWGLNLLLWGLFIIALAFKPQEYAVPLLALTLVQSISASNYDYVFLCLLALLPKQFQTCISLPILAGLTHFVALYWEGYPYDDIYFGHSLLIYVWTLLNFIIFVMQQKKRNLATREIKLIRVLGSNAKF